MFDLKSYLKSQKKRVETALDGLLNTAADSGRLTAAMSYSLMAGGKRIRPILCLAAAEAIRPAGGNQGLVKLACTLEMIHTYSLIHDDLPAMDNDTLRRGKPTCHVAFDEATAVLAGDALLTLAFETLADAAIEQKAQAGQWLEIFRLLSVAAGRRGMIEGQMRDILFEGQSIGLDQLKQVHALKTGALIRASVCSGALLAGARPATLENLSTYATHIGLAFQVADDILNVAGDARVMGKATGTDQMSGKATYPALLGVDGSRKFAEGLIENARLALAEFGTGAQPLHAIAEYIIDRNR